MIDFPAPGHFGGNHVWTCGLSYQEIGHKSQLFFNGGTRRKVLLVIRLVTQIAHIHNLPKQWQQSIPRGVHRSKVQTQPEEGRDILAGRLAAPMSRFATSINDPLRSYPQLIAVYGVLPNLFRAQSVLPRAIE